MKKTITGQLTEMVLGDTKTIPCDGIKKCRSVRQMAYQVGVERENEGVRYSCDVDKRRTGVTVTVVKR